MTGPALLCIRTVALDGVDETAANACRDVLDAEENERAGRYAFARDRIQYLVAHALTRRTLSRFYSDIPPTRWRFSMGQNGKPEAWAGERPAPVSFNLSHTHGMVGVAAMPVAGVPIGFDLEPLARRVTLALADRYFRVEEVAWLASLSQHEQSAGFLRLWTLKEAFIKATGEGLARSLASFWFAMEPPRIRFVGDGTTGTENWHFQQRILGDRFVAAVGAQYGDAGPPVQWEDAALGLHGGFTSYTSSPTG